MVTSDHDEVVDNESAYRLVQHWSQRGLQVYHCRIAQGHRWQSAHPARLVAARINTLLQDIEDGLCSSPARAGTASP